MADANVIQRTAAEWTRKNALLFKGDYGLERDTGKVKLGDGYTRWNQLAYKNVNQGEFPPAPPGVDSPVISVAGRVGEVSLDFIDLGGQVRESQIPGSITRDTEVSGLVRTAIDNGDIEVGGLTPAEKTKLSGIASEATKNATDSALRNRSSHTGTQPASTISDFQAAVTSTPGFGSGSGGSAPTTDAAALTTGFLNPDRISSLPASKISGTFGDIQIPASIARDSEVAAAILNKADLVNGRVADAQLPARLGAADLAASTMATVADPIAAAKNRANHFGQQTSGTISDFTEAVQDAVALLLGAGSNVLITYDDAANKLEISATASGGTGLDAEQVRDVIGVAMVGIGNISVVVNDAADTITFTTTATVNSTDSALRDRTSHTGLQPIATVTGLQAALTALYTKPANGIPATDLASDVRTSLSQIPVVQASLANYFRSDAAQIDSVSSPTAPVLVLKVKTELPPETDVPVDPTNPTNPTDPPPTTGPEEDPNFPGIQKQIDALMPHPYYTPRMGDPYQPVVVDRPPSKNGIPVGKLARPSLYNWPDETNTGLAVNNIKAADLRPVVGTVTFTPTSVTIGDTKYNRPTSGGGYSPVPGITVYPVNAGVTHAKHFAPVHNLIDRARVKGSIIVQMGPQSTLIVDSMIDAVGSKGAFYNNVGGTGAGGIGQNAGFLVAVNSRLYGGRSAQSMSNGLRWWVHHCNCSGANDTFEPFSSCYADFNYCHGLVKVGTYHNDFLQITKTTGDPAVNALFGGWNIRIRRNTGLAYGEKNGAQWLMLGNQQGDMSKVLVSENLGFGGVIMIHAGLGGYRSYGNNTDGTPVTRMSSLTGQLETHAFTKWVFIERNVFGRKATDAWPGGGRNGEQVPVERVAQTPGMYEFSSGGLYNDPPPYTLRGNVFDDTGTAACNDAGHGTSGAAAKGWGTPEEVATAEGLVFDSYPAAMPA